MLLSPRLANALVVLSFVLVFVATPALFGYAFEYHLVERDGVESDESLAVPYDSLTAEQRAAADRAIAGDGPWYRTRADAPIDGSAIVVEQKGEYHRIVLIEQFHAGSRPGMAAVAAPIVGVISLVAVIVHSLLRPSAVTG